MSLDIPVAFAQKYRDDVIMLSQQKESRLERTVRSDPDYLSGKAGYYDRIGSTEAQEVTGRHSDTQIVSTPHSRRRIILRDFDWADMIDKKDMRRILNAGQLPERYKQNAIWAMNRKKDDLIVAAGFGTAYAIDEDEGAAAVELPAGQLVPHGSAGLTLAKVLNAKEILDGNEVDEEEARFAVVSSKQITNMLNTTEVKSADYNTIKALVKGEINEFLGFEWIRSERLPTNSSSHRRCMFYSQNAIGLATGEDIGVDIGPRRDKRNSIQVYVDFSQDATRIEDEKFVEVPCVES